MTHTLSLFDLRLMNTDRSSAIANLLGRTAQTTVAFVNAHCVNTAKRDRIYRDVLDKADALLPDGAGISLAAKLAGKRVVENLNGTDLCLPLCHEAARRGLSIYLLGAAPGVAEAAADNLVLKVPGLRIAGTHHGYFPNEQTPDIISDINASGADILMVAMGVPRQEIWLDRHRHDLAPRLAMGVGALFDFLAGRVTRAPVAMRRLRMEWVWRLAIEPRRMFCRYVLGNPAFVARAVGHAMKAERRDRPPGKTPKRVLDVAGASLALLLAAPVLVFAVLAIKLTSLGPVLYHQQRVGFQGRPFRILKFRSMYIDAETRRAELLRLSEREGVCFKMKVDPRITPVGRFLRRYSIDELPQLVNVLKGDMSLVGPRPALPSEVAAYPPPARRRLEALPGITGIWQVSGRADIGFSRMVAMDVVYTRSRTMLLDLVLIAMTARAVISGRGAY